MSGQIIRRGKNTWLVRIYMGRNPQGKRKYHNKTVKGTRKDAERYRNQVLADHQNGTFVEPSRMPLTEYLPKWLDTSVKPRVREKTLEDYRYHVQHYIIPALGIRKLAEVGPREIQSFYNRLTARGLSPRTIRYIHSTLHSAFGQAVRWGELARNPATLVQLPRMERSERTVLTPAEMNKLLTVGAGTRWFPLWLLLGTTGLRPGEALGLRWGDLEGKTIRVKRALVRVKSKWMLEEPKTDRSRRAVVLSDTVLKALEAHRIEQTKERIAAGKEYRQDLNLVFANTKGEPLDYRTTVRRYFHPLVKTAGVPRIRPYDLRHTHATHLLLNNVHPKVVSERLGHSSTVMTMDVYSHVLPDMQDAAAEKIESLLFG